ncbi:MAG: tRNA lysidine(34) synthetase TilS [Pseudomonadota bacterium]|uniref:tRNA lysidine(34) synthetase TilS n=2 Tax=Roseovarius TaxID=74030 RepID=UPI0022A8BA17|nr:tRNA lysidine(34) synthetase TilS [Roseovarius sp. EGI FJ00037]MCZ0812661.1 tRNA lysidine(34) synthetase TilS [Roseovarius sp. EGI FJ00037]
MTGDADAMLAQIQEHFAPCPPERLGVAVSGGSDSLALLILLNDWRHAGGPDLWPVTVDHGLRPEAADEAARVAQVCAELDLPHDILKWSGWDGQGNLQDKARRARYALMAEWARAKGIAHVALGHTADDQAETFLMRLAREAGVDGLAAMVPCRIIAEVGFCRPLLPVTRAALRAELRARNIGWSDDPSNEDPAYERVRARAVLAQLAPLGITPEGLSRVARRLGDVRETLYTYASQAARDLVEVQSGDLVVDPAGLAALPPEVARRLLLGALDWISGAGYGPRGRAMDDLMQAIGEGRDMTLGGCLICPRKSGVRISREWKAVEGLRVPAGEVWDGRWQLEGPECPPGAEIAALGPDGLAACDERAQGGLPAASLMASPALWHGAQLLAAPLAGWGGQWRARLVRDEEAYLASYLSH